LEHSAVVEEFTTHHVVVTLLMTNIISSSLFVFTARHCMKARYVLSGLVCLSATVIDYSEIRLYRHQAVNADCSPGTFHLLLQRSW